SRTLHLLSHSQLCRNRYTTDTIDTDSGRSGSRTRKAVQVLDRLPTGCRCPSANPSVTLSSPGWTRTTDLPHVKGLSCHWTTGLFLSPLSHEGRGEPSTPTRSRTRNISVETRYDVPFTIGASSGRHGI